MWGVQGTGGTSSALLRTLTLCWGLRARTQSEPHSVSGPRLASPTPTRQAQERGARGAGGGGEAGGGRRRGAGAGPGRGATQGDELLRARVREAGFGEVASGDTEGLGRTLAGGQNSSAGDQLSAHALALAAAAAAAAGGSAVYGFGGDGLLRLTAQGSVRLGAGGADQVRPGAGQEVQALTFLVAR